MDVTSAMDVAAYLLENHGPMESMKLQKLVYYAQAYSMAWNHQPMFSEAVEAWAHGPVVRTLFREHQGKIILKAGDIPGDADALDGMAKDVVEDVWDSLGELTGWQLRTRTHAEAPWRNHHHPDARHPNKMIPLGEMEEFYQ